MTGRNPVSVYFQSIRGVSVVSGPLSALRLNDGRRYWYRQHMITAPAVHRADDLTGFRRFRGGDDAERRLRADAGVNQVLFPVLFQVFFVAHGGFLLV